MQQRTCKNKHPKSSKYVVLLCHGLNYFETVRLYAWNFWEFHCCAEMSVVQNDMYAKQKPQSERWMLNTELYFLFIDGQGHVGSIWLFVSAHVDAFTKT